jgi:hypothetical protein
MITSQSVRRQIRAIEEFHASDASDHDEDMFLAGALIALEWVLEGRQRYKPTTYLVKIPKWTGFSIRQIWSTRYADALPRISRKFQGALRGERNLSL